MASKSFPSLVITRLAGLSFERHIPPEDAAGGVLVTNYRATGTPSEDSAQAICVASIEISGESKGEHKDSEVGKNQSDKQTAFTASCEVEGIFEVGREVEEDESLSQEEVTAMAAHLFPLVADYLQTLITKAGYGRPINIPIQVKPVIDSNKD